MLDTTNLLPFLKLFPGKDRVVLPPKSWLMAVSPDLGCALPSPKLFLNRNTFALLSLNCLSISLYHFISLVQSSCCLNLFVYYPMFYTARELSL